MLEIGNEPSEGIVSLAYHRRRRRQEMVAISGAHDLLTSIVLALNTSRMDGVVARLSSSGLLMEDDCLPRIGMSGDKLTFSGIGYEREHRCGKVARRLLGQTEVALRRIGGSAAGAAEGGWFMSAPYDAQSQAVRPLSRLAGGPADAPRRARAGMLASVA